MPCVLSYVFSMGMIIHSHLFYGNRKYHIWQIKEIYMNPEFTLTHS